MFDCFCSTNGAIERDVERENYNQLGPSLHQISLGSALHDTSYVQLPKQADAPVVCAILRKRETMPGLLKAETTRNRVLNI